MRISRIAPSAMIALCVGLSGVPATAQVGEADKCVKVHERACTKDGGGYYFMDLHVQNTCSRDITVFLRVDAHNADHPKAMQYRETKHGVPWGYRSSVRHFVPRRTPPKPHGNLIVPCWKKVHYVYCAEYNPDNYRNLTKNAYMKKLPKSVCYRSIVKDPLVTRAGVRFHPLTDFHPLVGGDYYSDRFKGEAAETNHISKLPKPAAN